MNRYAIFIIISVFILQTGLAQSVKNFTVANKPEDAGMSAERLARIDNLLNSHVKDGLIPGAVTLIIRNGKIVQHKAYGYSDASRKTPLNKTDIFRIASQSKAITSLAVMMLFEEGKFLLDEPVSKYIPQFASPKVLKTFNAKDSTFTTEPAKGEVTIRQLLTHTSGIDYSAIGSNDLKAIYAKAGIPSGIGSNNSTIGEKMRILGAMPLKHNPGEKWTYGLNNDVLGYLVEIWSGMTFDQFLRTRIFEPLGMNDTYFYLPKEKYPRLVKLYGANNGKAVPIESKIYDEVDPNYPATNGTYYSGGAGLSSTVEDYAKFLQLFLNKGEFNGKRLLSRKTVELMLTDQVSDEVSKGNEIGLGFGLETQANDYRTIFSVGSFSWGGAFNTQYWADPQEKVIALIYTNLYNTPYWYLGEYFKTFTYQAIID
jgi:CubicO group peptidase (beta-lactamase class C family)